MWIRESATRRATKQNPQAHVEQVQWTDGVKDSVGIVYGRMEGGGADVFTLSSACGGA